MNTRSWLPLLSLLLAACAPLPAALEPGRTTFTLSFERLAPLAPADGAYEAWAETPAGLRSLGKFTVAPDGGLRAADGRPLDGATIDVGRASVRALVVTQEPPGDTNAVPSDQVFLRGTFDGERALLEPPMAASRLADRKGTYVLENAATDRNPEDWNGLWFAEVVQAGEYGVDYRADMMKPGLDLEMPPTGWMYASWLRLGGQMLRLGKFDRVDRADDWYGYSGLTGTSLPINMGGPPVPGEDLIKNLPAEVATGFNQPDLAGAQVIVSLESALLAGEETQPSPLRIFEAEVPRPSVRLVNLPLTNVAVRGWPAGVGRWRP